MPVRVSLAAAASLFLAVSANPAFAATGAHSAAAHAAGTAATNWTDASLNAAKVDYFFTVMDKLLDYQIAHPDADLDAIALDGNES